ncbi:Hint domain-containing protein [Rhodobacterales bacterium HKCCA1288]|jgi:hypothetical protein|uniref:Hint domain-containing protein n=1 Tax=Roseovarius sp. 10 TaxID=3080563 RepID=UPI0019360D3E|nr:Hint domain-containing protein [Roseovarius sp. 10]MBF9055078.1 type I secretion protein [Rhodobacterales bacterium HKCCA1065]MDV7199922.1 Hint domain-containing protein [Roseovarius sp. 10]QPI85997.1 Hint domain-containing protein [Rhodobacterales bacterium HKCCA1288]
MTAQPQSYFHAQDAHTAVTPCFTPGTMIATLRGERAVETLQQGDKIVTRDNGVQEIAWIGGRVLGRADMQRAASLRPVLLRAGCLGHGLPVRDMLVSPSHRILLMPEHPAALAGESLIAARDLIDHREVMAVDTVRVNYIHIMFEHHQIVMSDSIWTESFHAETKTLRGMDAAQRREILSLFPELETEEGQSAQATAARPIVDYASDIRTDRMMRNII